MSEQTNWRKHLPVHPAAELFPMMPESELRELGEDIKKNGLLSPIAIYDGRLVDGRNRLDAIELVGMKFEFERARRPGGGSEIIQISSDDFIVQAMHSVLQLCGNISEDTCDPYDFAISANLQRRHLGQEQKRELIAKLLKAKPEQSNRQIAKQVGAHHAKVADVRAEAEATGLIYPVEKTVGADGRARPAKPKAKPRAKPSYVPSLIDDAMALIAEMSPMTLQEFDRRYRKKYSNIQAEDRNGMAAVR
jgi:hypothetical protein